MGHFLCSRAHIQQGRLYTLLTSAFSHQRPLHFFGNILGVYVVGGTVAQALSPGEFAALLLSGSYGSSLAQVLRSAQPAIGGSGAVMGVLTAGALVVPREKIHIWFPFPGLSLSMLQVADLALIGNLAGFVMRGLLPAGAWTAHIGGTLGGFAFAGVLATVTTGRVAHPLCLHAKYLEVDWRQTLKGLEKSCQLWRRWLSLQDKRLQRSI